MISSLRSADELALAMESRCYGYTEKRTKLKILRFTSRDLIASLTVILLIGAMLVIKYNASVWGESFPWMYY